LQCGGIQTPKSLRLSDEGHLLEEALSDARELVLVKVTATQFMHP
jgi:hypothetical protein